MFGLTRDDIPDEDIEVLQVNWDTFLVFDALSTQWRVGACGVTGLDYNAIPVVMKSLNMKKKNMPEIFYGLRIMESEAMKVMREKQE